jgi:hypothetical protein
LAYDDTDRLRSVSQNPFASLSLISLPEKKLEWKGETKKEKEGRNSKRKKGMRERG